MELFVDGRCISSKRPDLADILTSTGMQSAVELAFRSGGFSLFDQYWYREKASTLA